MSGRRSQAKGRRAELELAQYLQEHGCADAKAGEPLNFGTVPDVTGIDGLHIECKRPRIGTIKPRQTRSA